jgi:DNA-binding NtrC family response regulator
MTSQDNRPTVSKKAPSTKVSRLGKPTLLVVSGDEVIRQQLPDKGTLTIGRLGDSDVQINDSSISRLHAKLELGSSITIEDCDSLNGVWVGGRRLSSGEKAVCVPGDIIELGDATLVIQQKTISRAPWQIWEHSYFEARLVEECSRPQKMFAVVLVQVPKSLPGPDIEDAFGQSLRPGDVVATAAPGEYEFLLLDASADDADAVCRRFVDLLDGKRKGISLGIACCPRDARDASALVAHARATLRGDRADEGAQAVVMEDQHMQRLCKLVERVAPSNINVIILGETGVGKEVMARLIHSHSGRPEDLFVSVNCAALPESLLESELFGHERGAFTGADKAKPGLLEVAGDGTFLLDEISELPVALQAKLLRVIEEREAVRIGGLKPYRIDARFIATTNRDLEEAVARGAFRQDLFFRLDGISLFIPPLRERITAIEPLVRVFIRQACMQANRPLAEITKEALASLENYWWPGNVRELRNVVERAVVLSASGLIEAEHVETGTMVSSLFTPPTEVEVVPRQGSQPPGRSGIDDPFGRIPTEMKLKDEVKELERQRIVDALRLTEGNQTKAAKLLGMSRRALINRLDAFDIERPRKGSRKKT